ncbi:hypothetical protein K3148_11495 [Qipengyuania aurantiaca]|uniref:RING-type E3 ubiquitin transferase n=1 Tax=Qipengyuania aurantiaca TaxID=2867233 RepID=A0ABX8ZNX8_9SPHN|nr:hypothetical protein [Qipengyuania aurantiaca]QZD89429.1 hypothetical protein K3148_11495 [Qipengyuania aurantiaca]
MMIMSIAAVLFIGASHAYFYRDRSEKAKRIGQYVAILIGGVGLVGIFYSSAGDRARFELEMLEYDKFRAQQDVLRAVDYVAEFACGAERVRSEFSPSNFDQIVASEAAACEAGTLLKIESPEWFEHENSIIVRSRPDAQISDEIFLEPFQHLDKQITQYNLIQDDRGKNLKVLRQSDIEILMKILGPYAAILAFALGLGATCFAVREM